MRRDYVVGRLLSFVPALLGASFVIFGLLRRVPGDIAEILVFQTGSESSTVQQKQIRQIRTELQRHILTSPSGAIAVSWVEGWFFRDKRVMNYKPAPTAYDANTFMKV